MIPTASVAIKEALASIKVSKTKPVEALLEAYQAGQRDFGENYVEELVEKAPLLPKDIRWHFIGHLQSNKIPKLMGVELFSVHTVDSLKLAKKLHTACESRSIPKLNIMIQVKTSDEDSKEGVAAGTELNELVKCIHEECTRLHLQGLMTIGKEGDTEAFKSLKLVRAEVAKQTGRPEESFELSMGMSGDFETAILHGSTCVRVGSSIFGARDYTKK